MSSYYTVLGVEPEASQEAIEQAYRRQRERYNPERVREIDPDLRQIAEQRTAELERAYQILADPERRRQYDVSINTTSEVAGTATQRRSLSPRERIYALGGAIVAIVLIAAIWLLTGREAGPEATAMSTVNRPAPVFTLPALDGETIALESYRGKVVVLNFWGTWCEPCKREIPALQAAHEQLGNEGLAIIGVDLMDDERLQGSDEEDVRAFLAQFGVSYPIALDVGGEVATAYRIFPLPTSFFIDGQGKIRYVHIGELTLDDVVARFDELRPTIASSTP